MLNASTYLFYVVFFLNYVWVPFIFLWKIWICVLQGAEEHDNWVICKEENQIKGQRSQQPPVS